jgi:DnaJ like chaperone protein
VTLWTRLSRLLADLPLFGQIGSFVDVVTEAIRSTFSGTERRQLGFTVAMIALSAKMAKADGVVTSDEVDVVKRLFVVPDHERPNVARLFNLAKQDVAGFEAYARRIGGLFADEPEELEDILDGLFHIACADGIFHDEEFSFLKRVSQEFGQSAATFAHIKARHIAPDKTGPYLVLGVEPDADMVKIKSAWRQLVKDNHPDRLIARGLPPDAIVLANERIRAINAAYETIQRQRQQAVMTN